MTHCSTLSFADVHSRLLKSIPNIFRTFVLFLAPQAIYFHNALALPKSGRLCLMTLRFCFCCRPSIGRRHPSSSVFHQHRCNPDGLQAMLRRPPQSCYSASAAGLAVHFHDPRGAAASTPTPLALAWERFGQSAMTGQQVDCASLEAAAKASPHR